MIEVIKSLGPSAITVVLTAIFAAYFVPRWQERTNNRRIIIEKRLNSIEEISNYFSRYVLSWRRLIQISKGMEKYQPADADFEQLRKYAEQRSSHKDNLFAALHKSTGYYDADTIKLMSEFMVWDEAQSIKEINDLPSIDEWWEWQMKIVSAMKTEVSVIPGISDL